MNASIDSDVARIYDACFANVGGYLDLKLLPPEFPLIHSWAERAEMFCAHMTQQLNQQDRPIIFGFINNLELQACVSGYRNMIAVYLGVPLALIETFSRLLALPSFLPRLGNPSLACEISPIGKFPLPKHGYLDVDRLPLLRCPIRMSASSFLARCAFDFLLGHEMGHLERGHCFLEGIEYPQHRIWEHPKPNTGSLLSQVLELDADQHGIMHCVRTAINIGNHLKSGWNPGSPEMCAAASALFGEPKTALHTSIFALWVLFKLFDEDYESPLENRSHPPHIVRCYFMLSCVENTLSRNSEFGLESSDIQEVVKGAIHAAELAVQELTDMKEIVVMHPQSPEEQHAQRLLNQLHELEPKLRTVQLFPFEHFS